MTSTQLDLLTEGRQQRDTALARKRAAREWEGRMLTDQKVQHSAYTRFQAGWQEQPNDCWAWTKTKNNRGYGMLFVAGSMRLAHRVAYLLATHEDLPLELQLDHLCHNRGCVNPGHLEPVTPSENTRRGYAGSLGAARALAKTHCPSGHPYDETNTGLTNQGHRYCRICARSASKRYAERARDAAVLAVLLADTEQVASLATTGEEAA